MTQEEAKKLLYRCQQSRSPKDRQVVVDAILAAYEIGRADGRAEANWGQEPSTKEDAK